MKIMNSKLAALSLGVGMLALLFGSNRAISQTADLHLSKATVAPEIEKELQKCAGSDSNRAARYSQLDQRLQNQETYLFFCGEEYIGQKEFHIYTPSDGNFSAKGKSRSNVSIIVISNKDKTLCRAVVSNNVI